MTPRPSLHLALVDSALHVEAARLRRRSRGRGRPGLTWREAVTAAARWQAPDPLCPRRAEVVFALATRAVGWW